MDPKPNISFICVHLYDLGTIFSGDKIYLNLALLFALSPCHPYSS